MRKTDNILNFCVFFYQTRHWLYSIHASYNIWGIYLPRSLFFVVKKPSWVLWEHQVNSAQGSYHRNQNRADDIALIRVCGQEPHDILNASIVHSPCMGGFPCLKELRTWTCVQGAFFVCLYGQASSVSQHFIERIGNVLGKGLCSWILLNLGGEASQVDSPSGSLCWVAHQSLPDGWVKAGWCCPSLFIYNFHL